MKSLLKKSHIVSQKNDTIQELYSIYKNDFIRYAVNQFKIPEEQAYDIYHDSFMAMIENIKNGKYTPMAASLKTYLFSIGKNHIRKYLQKKEIQLLPTEWAQQQHSNLEWKRAVEVTTELISENEDSICNQVLRLFYWKKASMKEIAQEMNYQSEAVAKNKKNSCLRRFSFELKKRLQALNIHF